jgi:hypothetical protein
MLELLPVEAWRLRIKQASRPTRFLRAKLLFAVIICDAASDCQAERRKLFEPFPDLADIAASLNSSSGNTIHALGRKRRLRNSQNLTLYFYGEMLELNLMRS